MTRAGELEEYYVEGIYNRLCETVEHHGWGIGIWVVGGEPSEARVAEYAGLEYEMRVWDKSFARRTMIRDGLGTVALDGAAARITHQLIKAGKLPS